MQQISEKIAEKRYFFKPWYYQPWFILILFSFFWLVLPAIAGLVLLILDIVDTKDRKKQVRALNLDKLALLDLLEKDIAQKTAHESAIATYSGITTVMNKRKAEVESLENDIQKKRSYYAALGTLEETEKAVHGRQAEINKLDAAIKARIEHQETLATLDSAKREVAKTMAQQVAVTQKISELDSKLIQDTDELEMQEFGFFEKEFAVGTPQEYKAKMIDLQNKQKMMVTDKTASQFEGRFTYNNSLKEGRKMVTREVKIALWAFNTHCDNVITNVTYRNRAASERKIRRAYEIINQNEQLQSLTSAYLTLKLEELDATFKYKVAVENEKELLREQREKEREDKKLQQEIAAARAKIAKDETHVNTELARLKALYGQESADKEAIKRQVAELQAKLAALGNKKQTVNAREANAQAGYVYVISNIGSFGEGVVKIGVTRRLEPLDRIKELGDASVPFTFDIHALIFSDKAFALENALHRRFEKNRVNAINQRKEFFRVQVADVKAALVSEFDGGLVAFENEAEAREYRESLRLMESV